MDVYLKKKKKIAYLWPPQLKILGPSLYASNVLSMVIYDWDESNISLREYITIMFYIYIYGCSWLIKVTDFFLKKKKKKFTHFLSPSLIILTNTLILNNKFCMTMRITPLYFHIVSLSVTLFLSTVYFLVLCSPKIWLKNLRELHSLTWLKE